MSVFSGRPHDYTCVYVLSANAWRTMYISWVCQSMNIYINVWYTFGFKYSIPIWVSIVHKFKSWSLHISPLWKHVPMRTCACLSVYVTGIHITCVSQSGYVCAWMCQMAGGSFEKWCYRATAVSRLVIWSNKAIGLCTREEPGVLERLHLCLTNSLWYLLFFYYKTSMGLESLLAWALNFICNVLTSQYCNRKPGRGMEGGDLYAEKLQALMSEAWLKNKQSSPPPQPPPWELSVGYRWFCDLFGNSDTSHLSNTTNMVLD